jgi:hypothetical protein
MTTPDQIVLFGRVEVEPMVTDGDTPRARRSDPAASHLAGDRSQRGLSKLRVAVLRTLLPFGAKGLTGVALNAIYQKQSWVFKAPYPKCAYDSPRKRVAELADMGFVDVVAHNHGTLEAVYAISPEGRLYLEGLSNVSAA